MLSLPLGGAHAARMREANMRRLGGQWRGVWHSFRRAGLLEGAHTLQVARQMVLQRQLPVLLYAAPVIMRGPDLTEVSTWLTPQLRQALDLEQRVHPSSVVMRALFGLDRPEQVVRRAQLRLFVGFLRLHSDTPVRQALRAMARGADTRWGVPRASFLSAVSSCLALAQTTLRHHYPWAAGNIEHLRVTLWDALLSGATLDQDTATAVLERWDLLVKHVLRTELATAPRVPVSIRLALSRASRPGEPAPLLRVRRSRLVEFRARAALGVRAMGGPDDAQVCPLCADYANAEDGQFDLVEHWIVDCRGGALLPRPGGGYSTVPALGPTRDTVIQLLRSAVREGTRVRVSAADLLAEREFLGITFGPRSSGFPTFLLRLVLLLPVDGLGPYTDGRRGSDAATDAIEVAGRPLLRLLDHWLGKAWSEDD